MSAYINEKLENIAAVVFQPMVRNSAEALDKPALYLRKHGANAYYGQK